MSTYTLTVGLVIREGLRTWRLDRTLPDSQLSFLDQTTGALKTISIAQLQHDLEAGRIQVVQEYPVALSSAEDTKLRLVKTVESLPFREQVGYRLRLGFVKHMLRRGLRRGMRKAIQSELARMEGQLPHGVPPADVAEAQLSTTPTDSTVMAWMRTFERSGGNPMSLISGYCFRKMPRRLPIKKFRHERTKFEDERFLTSIFGSVENHSSLNCHFRQNKHLEKLCSGKPELLAHSSLNFSDFCSFKSEFLRRTPARSRIRRDRDRTCRLPGLRRSRRPQG